VPGPPRDLEAVARPRGRLDHVPLAGRAGQRREPAPRHRHFVGQRRHRRPRRMPGRNRAGLCRADEPGRRAAWNDQFPFRQHQRLARRGRDLHDRARPREARRGHDPGDPGPLQALLPEEGVHLGQDSRRRSSDHPGQPQPAARQGAGRRRAQDRPYRRGRLRLHRLGRAGRPAHRHGRRGPVELQPADRGIGQVHGLGLPRLEVPAPVQRRREGGRGPGPARRRPRKPASPTASAATRGIVWGGVSGVETTRSLWSRRAASPLHCRRERRAISGSRSSTTVRSRLRSPRASISPTSSSRPRTRRPRRCPWSPPKRSARPASSAGSGTA
jgi:hypothetical protein